MAVIIKNQIKKDFEYLNEFDLERFFDSFSSDKRTLSFIKYYNRTVLDKEPLDFGEFKHLWAIQGMKTETIKYFNDNLDAFKNEITEERNIKKFFLNHCCTDRKESSFCSKLFHTILPHEFPPLDNPIKKRFKLQNEDFIRSILILKLAYNLFFEENSDKIHRIRRLLNKLKFAYLRVVELSDIRILDMYYWFKENREKTLGK